VACIRSFRRDTLCTVQHRADTGYATGNEHKQHISCNISPYTQCFFVSASSKLVIGPVTCPFSPSFPSDRHYHHHRLPCPHHHPLHLACPIPRPLCLPSSSSFGQHRRRLIETVGMIFGGEEVAIDPAEEEKSAAISKFATVRHWEINSAVTYVLFERFTGVLHPLGQLVPRSPRLARHRILLLL
jgi:hypothetical protein